MRQYADYDIASTRHHTDQAMTCMRQYADSEITSMRHHTDQALTYMRQYAVCAEQTCGITMNEFMVLRRNTNEEYASPCGFTSNDYSAPCGIHDS